MSDYTHIVVGAGRMGGAMIHGWTSGRRPSVPYEKILIVDPSPGEAAQKLIQEGCGHSPEMPDQLPGAEYVLLAIKPQSFAKVAPSIAPALPKTCVVISIMAGITTAQLSEALWSEKIVRAMPNTPAAIGKGITAFACLPSVTGSEKKTVKKLLSAGGKTAEVQNDQMIDMVTAVSGSGPAYFFHMVESLEAAAIKIGLPADLAPEFARQTLIGAGALLESSGESAKDLREAVTSPNGTTQAALDVLMSEAGLPPIMRDTVQAAFKRARELGQK